VTFGRAKNGRGGAALQNVTAISTSNSRLRFGVRWRSGALDSASWIGEANHLFGRLGEHKTPGQG
jgi:hypothetical protein